jgi:hypothetical protein
MGLLRAFGLIAAAAATVAVGATDEQKKDPWVSPFEGIYTEGLCEVRFPYDDKSDQNTKMRIGCIENIPYNFLALYEERDLNATLQCRDQHTAAADIELCKKITLGKSYGRAERQRNSIQLANRKVLRKKNLNQISYLLGCLALFAGLCKNAAAHPPSIGGYFWIYLFEALWVFSVSCGAVLAAGLAWYFSTTLIDLKDSGLIVGVDYL